MANSDDDDFTFCTVAPTKDVTEAEKVSDDINTIRIDDGNREGVNTTSDQNSGSIWNVNGSTEKQEKVGLLSFRVIDASTRKEVSQLPKVAVQENGGSSLELKKAPVKKSVARGKVPFEKGYSPMDWLKLTRTHPDLAGLKGQSNRRFITLNEVKQHQSGDSMWTVLKGRVYNIAPYLKFHPGGADILMKAVGKDCTSLFNKYHAWVNEDFLLEKCLVGILDGGK